MNGWQVAFGAAMVIGGTALVCDACNAKSKGLFGLLAAIVGTGIFISGGLT